MFGDAGEKVRIPVSVTKRETLLSDRVVKIKVPTGATAGSFPNGNDHTPYLKFCQHVRGGVVNFFVHSDGVDLRGRVITAKASVHKKSLEDGREYLYVDLVPAACGTPVTHRLTVMTKGDGSWQKDGHQVFETPAPISGLIIFAPPEAKMIPAGMPVHPTPRTRKPSETGDPQLDRLLGDGWQIERESPTQVELFKMKGVKRKTITHYRPKHLRA